MLFRSDSYAEADELFARVRAIDQALADRYAYLGRARAAIRST